MYIFSTMFVVNKVVCMLNNCACWLNCVLAFHHHCQITEGFTQQNIPNVERNQNNHIWNMKGHWSRNHHNRFTALFPGPPGWAGARKELLDFMVQRKINRGRHTDHPAGRHSIRTNQCQPPPPPYFLQAGCPSCRLTNSVKALKATSAFGLGRGR